MKSSAGIPLLPMGSVSGVGADANSSLDLIIVTGFSAAKA